MNMPFKFCCGLLVLLLSMRLYAQPLFDSHLHYSADDAQGFNPQAIIELLDNNGIHFAAVTGTPTEHVSKLYHLAPERIVPLLSVYRDSVDKGIWTGDKTLIPYFEKELESGYWRGIGELHVFANSRDSDVFKRVIALASEKQLPLLIHCDPVVIDKLYEIAPKQKVVWAHAGTFPYTDLVTDYLYRYPNLSIDVSMRDERIAPNGIINDDWYELFVTYPDRFLIGVDTYSTARWQNFDSAVETIHHWLKQLPDDVTVQLAYNNAARLFNKPLIIKSDKDVDGTNQ